MSAQNRVLSSRSRPSDSYQKKRPSVRLNDKAEPQVLGDSRKFELKSSGLRLMNSTIRLIEERIESKNWSNEGVLLKQFKLLRGFMKNMVHENKSSHDELEDKFVHIYKTTLEEDFSLQTDLFTQKIEEAEGRFSTKLESEAAKLKGKLEADQADIKKALAELEKGLLGKDEVISQMDGQKSLISQVLKAQENLALLMRDMTTRQEPSDVALKAEIQALKQEHEVLKMKNEKLGAMLNLRNEQISNLIRDMKSTIEQSQPAPLLGKLPSKMHGKSKRGRLAHKMNQLAPIYSQDSNSSTITSSQVFSSTSDNFMTNISSTE